MKRPLRPHLILVAILGSACTPETPPPLAPPPVFPPASRPPTMPDVSWPSLSPTARGYHRVTPSAFNLPSRYVFYDDSAFGLQYMRHNSEVFEYRGKYIRRSTEQLELVFDDGRVSAPWEGTATLAGDSLTVALNDHMHWDDFEDGVYVRRTP